MAVFIAFCSVDPDIFYQKVSQRVMVLYTHELHNRLHQNVLIFIQLTKLLKEAHYSSDFTLYNTLVFTIRVLQKLLSDQLRL